jgi:hypothetical protein
VHIVYLDQNKWIELARAAKFPTERPELRALLDATSDEVRAGRLALPLTATNIYETYKINNPQRRQALASIQAFLSKGLVFRGKHKRLEVEISILLRKACNLAGPQLETHWFLSNIFFEAFLEFGDERLQTSISDRVFKIIRTYPDFCLYDYLVESSDEDRSVAVSRFSAGSEQLRLRIEKRRARHKNEPLAMRRRIYGALLLIDEIESVLGIARKAGMSWNSVSDMGASIARKMVNDVPTYCVERELALRLEAQNRAIDENDFRDMQSFCAVLPNADQVIAENQFVNLAKQGGLDKKYNTQLATDIFALHDTFR